jgi:hypothetical protein
MPSTKGKDNNYRDIFFPTTKEGRAEINSVVVAAHNKAIEGKIAACVAAQDKAEERPSATGKLEAAKKEAAAKPPAKGKAAPAKGKGGDTL